MYEIFNQGPNPFVLRDVTGKYIKIDRGQTLSVDITPETARVIANRRKGNLKLHLTDAQAKEIDAPLKTPDGKIEIPKNWEDKPWRERKALAIALNKGFNVTNSKHAKQLIEAELATRVKDVIHTANRK